MRKQFKETIVVLGMHRSGTSCVSGLLSELGYYIGNKDNLLEADSYNQQGYYEDASIVACNEKLFREQINSLFYQNPELKNICFDTGLNYYGWIYGAWSSLYDYDIKNESHLITQATTQYRGAEDSEKKWIIKDPRLTLTYHCWAKYLNVKAIIIVVRNPGGVAQSLLSRNGISPQVAADLYYLYNRAALIAASGKPHIIIDYDELVGSSGSSQIDKLIDFLKKENLIDKAVDRSRMRALIKNDLNHADTESDILKNDEINELYKLVKSGEGFIDKQTGHYSLDKIHGRFLNVLIELNHLYEKKKLEELNARFERINRHPVIGRILSMVRTIKKDTTFGSNSDL